MLFTGAQYCREKFNYRIASSPLNASLSLVEITKGFNGVRQIVEDHKLEVLINYFETASTEIDLDVWFSDLIEEIKPINTQATNLEWNTTEW